MFAKLMYVCILIETLMGGLIPFCMTTGFESEAELVIKRKSLNLLYNYRAREQ